MTRYLISFDEGTMIIPAEELAAVSEASHAVVAEAKAAGVWVTGGGVDGHEVSVVAPDGAVSHGSTEEHLGGFSVVDVPSHDEALEWAARIAVACRCPQEVRALQHDPEA